MQMFIYPVLVQFNIFCLLVNFYVLVSHLPRHVEACCYPCADVSHASVVCACLTQ